MKKFDIFLSIIFIVLITGLFFIVIGNSLQNTLIGTLTIIYFIITVLGYLIFGFSKIFENIVFGISFLVGLIFFYTIFINDYNNVEIVDNIKSNIVTYFNNKENIINIKNNSENTSTLEDNIRDEIYNGLNNEINLDNLGENKTLEQNVISTLKYNGKIITEQKINNIIEIDKNGKIIIKK